MVHPRPWGSQCSLQKADTATDMADTEGATGGKPESSQNVNDDNNVDAATLLTSFKDMSSKLSSYDKTISDLAQKVDAKQTRPAPMSSTNPTSDTTQSGNAEAVFVNAATAAEGGRGHQA